MYSRCLSDGFLTPETSSSLTCAVVPASRVAFGHVGMMPAECNLPGIHTRMIADCREAIVHSFCPERSQRPRPLTHNGSLPCVLLSICASSNFKPPESLTLELTSGSLTVRAVVSPKVKSVHPGHTLHGVAPQLAKAMPHWALNPDPGSPLVFPRIRRDKDPVIAQRRLKSASPGC